MLIASAEAVEVVGLTAERFDLLATGLGIVVFGVAVLIGLEL